MPKGSQKKVWLPEFLRNSPGARESLGVLVTPGQEPKTCLAYRHLWEQRVRELYLEDEDPQGAELVQMWEELEGQKRLLGDSPEAVLDLVDGLAAPMLWRRLTGAWVGDKEDQAALLEQFPPEGPLSPEEELREHQEVGLHDLLANLGEESPHQRMAYQA